MQLKLKLPGTTLDPPPPLWNQLDPNAQKMLVQTLAKAIVKALSQNPANHNNREEHADDRKQ